MNPPPLFSIKNKIVLATSLTLFTALGVSLMVATHGERKLAEDTGIEQARSLARTYFDGINTLMLTGSMAQRDTLRKKLLNETGVRGIDIIHSADFAALGISQPHLAGDELEQQALAGNNVTVTRKLDHERTVIYLTPIIINNDHLGTDCQGCHALPPNSVAAAIRVEYSLAALDSRIRRDLLTSLALNAALFIASLLLLLPLLRAIVIDPVQRITRTMLQIQRDADLTQRLDITRQDEMGALAAAINLMLERFRDSLMQLANTARHLATSATHIARTSDRTVEAATRQCGEIDMATRFVGNLDEIARQVGHSADETAAASVNADRQAMQSTQMTRDAIGGISSLVHEIGATATAIEQLNERSVSVSSVLEVIRGIAEQTNLLALNAAIEAARAGDAGRGFAVVADEVRKLATLSHQSTHSIESLLTQFQIEARDAVRLMEQARQNAERYSNQLEQAVDGLDSISTRVSEIRNLNSGMVEAVTRQSDLTRNVNSRILNVNEIALLTSSEATQTRGVSEEMVALSRQLSNLVAEFKLD
ncbi:MAG: hypothetical protein RLZZ226_368 [Pseudomonadota bacterium]|jgi:methyl-accepting chemotaxis protein